MADIEHTICGAKTRSGASCKSKAVKGRDRCRMHGGSTPVGQHTGNIHASTHGIYSRKYSDDEIALLPELTQKVGSLTDEINLCRIQLRRIIALDDAIREGEVQAGMRLSEMQRVTRSREVTTTDESGEPVVVMQPEPTEDRVIRKLPDTQTMILAYTGRIQNLVIAANGVHIEELEALKLILRQRITEVEEEKRRLQQFGVITGGRESA